MKFPTLTYGLCCAHVGSFGAGFWMRKKQLQPKTCRLGLVLRALEGLCRANVGPFWVHVGPMLGHLVGSMGFHGGFVGDGT